MLELPGRKSKKGPRREPKRPRLEYRKIMIGHILHKVPTGHLIVRMEPLRRPPKLGVKVVDKTGKEVGVLADIIGPVEKPFAVIKPADGVDGFEEGVELFALIPIKKGRGKKARPRGSGRRKGRGRGGGQGREGGR